MSTRKGEKSGGTQRTALLKRAGLAGALIVALLVGLTWFEHEQTSLSPPPVAEVPPPLPELPRGAPPMPTAEAVEAMVAAEAGGAPSGDKVEPELTAAPVVVAPEQRKDETPPPATGAPRLVLGGGEGGAAAHGKPAPMAAAEPDASPAPKPAVEPAPKPAAAPAPLKDGFLVQLGVFGTLGNAQALADKVGALGIPAYIESRVVVGPFKNRAEADAARNKLRASGLGKGLVVRSH